MTDPRFDCRLCGKNAVTTMGAYAQTNEWETDPATGNRLNVVGWCCRACVRLLDLPWLSREALIATLEAGAAAPTWRSASELPLDGTET